MEAISPETHWRTLSQCSPFERWVVRQLTGARIIEDYVVVDGERLTADQVAADCGLAAWRINEIADRVIGRMKVMEAMERTSSQ